MSTPDPESARTEEPLIGIGRAAEFFRSFASLRTARAVFWVCLAVYTIDGAAYFGILNVLSLYLGDSLHFSDQLKHPAISFMTGTLTLAGALLGGISDRAGVRRTLMATIVLSFVGRAFLGGAPFSPSPHMSAWFGLFIIGVAAGVMQPAVYAGVKQATNAANATIGFSLLYALMNGGSLIETYASPFLRDHFRDHKLPGGESGEYAGVIWVCGGLTIAYLAIQLLFFPRNEGNPTPTQAATAKASSWRDHALLNPRFQFFIFILLPVRTLFAHQWLTLEDYMNRSFSAAVAHRYEWVLSINTFVIFIGTPVLAALTRRVHVVTMMIIGTLVTASATFLLVPGPNFYTLIGYELLFSIGEALWASRFLEYVADVAPPDKVGLYMGVAQIPWFLAKTTTGLYSGYLLAIFCPAKGPQSTGTLWLIYALIAMITPIGLIMARKWLKAGNLGKG